MAVRQLITTVAGLAFTAGAAGAADLTKVTFQTNWLAEAEHGGYYQAVVDGTYKQCGLDVTIVPGGPQVNGDALLMAGKVDFLMGGNMLSAFDAVKQGIPITVVAADFQKDPQMFMTHPGKVKSFEDMKTLGTMFVADSLYQTAFQWMITQMGFDPAKRKPYTFNAAPFIADPDSAQQGYVTSEPYAVEKQGGFTPDIWMLADNGFSTYATVIETMAPMIAKHPEVVKCFVDGSAIGWANYLYGDNKAANDLIKKDNPDMTDDQIAFSIKAMIDHGIVDSGDAQTMGIGAMTDARNEDFYNKMVEAGVIEKGIDIKKAYTLQFSNSGASLETQKKLAAK